MIFTKARVDAFFCWLQRGSIACLLAMAVYIAVVERPPLRYLQQPFPVLSKVVYPGDVLFMQVHRYSDESDDMSYTSSRWLVNVDSGDKVSLKPGLNNVSPGETSIITSNIVIPTDVLTESGPGMYYVAGVSEVGGAFARNFKVPWRSAEFRIERPVGEVRR